MNLYARPAFSTRHRAVRSISGRPARCVPMLASGAAVLECAMDERRWHRPRSVGIRRATSRNDPNRRQYSAVAGECYAQGAERSAGRGVGSTPRQMRDKAEPRRVGHGKAFPRADFQAEARATLRDAARAGRDRRGRYGAGRMDRLADRRGRWEEIDKINRSGFRSFPMAASPAVRAHGYPGSACPMPARSDRSGELAPMTGSTLFGAATTA